MPPARLPGLALLALIMSLALLLPARAEESAYATSAACAGCHPAETAAWTGSDHAWALKAPGADSVLGDFGDVTLTSRGLSARFFRDGAAYMVETEGPDGQPTTYQVRQAVGVHPLQQYLVETTGGRLQALDFAWDTVAGRWFDLYPDAPIPAGNGMHWTGSYKNWQSRCAECHETGYDKGFDPVRKTYASHAAEPAAACEACHGPAAEHVRLATAAAAGETVALPPLPALGPGHQTEELKTCGNCHSRRAAFSQSSPDGKGAFGDHFALSLLTPGLYFADGQQRDEVYILGSFLQSKMAAKGVTCSDCHDPHSGKLVAQGNAVCTQCHSEAGRAEFPTLTRKTYDSPDHTHHQPGTPGADCVSCHMPERTYMQIDARRDHFFRRPDPLQSKAAGAPDVCTTCHAGRTAEWAAGVIAGWGTEGDKTWQDRSAFIAFQAGDFSPQAIAALAAYAADPARPAVVRATAASMLAGADAATTSRLTGLLADDSDLIRAAAVGLFRQDDPLARYNRISPLLTDPISAVRQAAAAELAYFYRPGEADRDLTALEAGIAEYLAAQMAFADTPEAQMAMGGLNLSLRKWPEAIAAFSEAVALDPQLEQPWVMLARIKVAMGDLPGAGSTLTEALAALPGSAALWSQAADLALRQEDSKAAIAAFQKVVGLDPRNVDAWLEISTLSAQAGDIETALTAGDNAVQIAPDRPETYLASAIAHYLAGDMEEARRRTLRVMELAPDIPIPPPLQALVAQ